MKGYKHYSKEEDDLIRKHWPEIGIKVASLLPARTKRSVERRAHVLKVVRRESFADWNEDELTALRKYWPSMGVKCVIHIKTRTKSSISCKAKKLGLQIEKKPRKPREQKKQPPLVTKREDKRNARWCYGYIPGGPVASVFDLGSRA